MQHAGLDRPGGGDSSGLVRDRHHGAWPTIAPGLLGVLLLVKDFAAPARESARKYALYRATGVLKLVAAGLG